MMIQWRIIFCIATATIVQGDSIGIKNLEKSDYVVGPSTDTDVFIECNDLTCVEKSDSTSREEPSRQLFRVPVSNWDPKSSPYTKNDQKDDIESNLYENGDDDGCNDELCIQKSDDSAMKILAPAALAVKLTKRFGINNLDRNFRFRFRASPEFSSIRIVEKKDPTKFNSIERPSRTPSEIDVPMKVASSPVREIRLKHQVPSRKIRDEPERYLMWRKIAG